MKDLFGILVILKVNVINCVTLENTYIIKTVNVEKVFEECSENIDEY